MINKNGRTDSLSCCANTQLAHLTYWSIMRSFTPHRKIWENHFGPIPKDNLGRTYEIHHIDENHKNNEITNLKLVTIQEHYDIHYQLQDWKACVMIGLRLKMDGNTISDLNSKAAKQRVANGTHHFVGSTNPSIRKSKDGTHHFQNSDYQKTLQQRRMSVGTHNFLGDTNPAKREWACPHCGKRGTGLSNATRWHFEN